jgi:hypothetical protein
VGWGGRITLVVVVVAEGAGDGGVAELEVVATGLAEAFGALVSGVSIGGPPVVGSLSAVVADVATVDSLGAPSNTPPA